MPHALPQGLACCFGICAISHLDDTLAQLEDFVRSDVFRKSIGIFNIFKVQQSVQGGGLMGLDWVLRSWAVGQPGSGCPAGQGWGGELHPASVSSWVERLSVGSPSAWVPLFLSAPWWPVEAAFLPKPITGGLGACPLGGSQSQTLRAGLCA